MLRHHSTACAISAGVVLVLLYTLLDRAYTQIAEASKQMTSNRSLQGRKQLLKLIHLVHGHADSPGVPASRV